MKHSPPEDKNVNISVWGILIMEGAVGDVDSAASKGLMGISPTVKTDHC